MLRRTTVRDEIDRALHLASPTDALLLLQQDTATAPQTSVGVAQTRLEAHDRNSMEAGLHSDLALLVPVHHAETIQDVAKFEN